VHQGWQGAIERVVVRCLARLDRDPADLWVGEGADLAGEDLREQLGAQAAAQHRHPAVQRLPEQSALVLESGELGVLVGVCGAAEHDQRGIAAEGERWGSPRRPDGQVDAMVLEWRCKRPDWHGRVVLGHEHSHVLPPATLGRHASVAISAQKRLISSSVLK
jgi:hypothetical protein